MPVEQRSTSAQLRSIAIGIVGLLVAALLVVAIVRIATGRGGGTTSGSGGGRFVVGDAAQLARNIRSDGPFLLSDVSGNGQNRPIFVSHQGDDVETGWHAFEARPAGKPPDCYVRWDRDAEELRSSCSDQVFPLDGDGLRPYPVEVTDAGDVVVDLSQDQGSDPDRSPGSDASS